jgi:hypothetical protein
VWLWLRKKYPPETAAALTLLFALNPLVLSRTGQVMPEAAWLAVAAGLLVALEKPRWPAWGTGLALLFAYLVRPASLPLLAAVWLARRRELKREWTAWVLPVLGVAGWMGWSHLSGDHQEARELSVMYGGGSWASLGRAALSNAAAGAETWGSTFLSPWTPRPALARGIGSVFLILAAAGLGKNLLRKRGADPADLFLAGSLLMHLAWPWWYDRYLLVLLPFLCSQAADALPAREKVRAAALAGLVALQFAVHGGVWLMKSRETGRPPLAGLYAWIQSHTGPQEAFASAFYGRDVLYSGRVFHPLPSAETPEEFRRELSRRRIRYVLWQDLEFGFSLPDNPAARRMDRIRGHLAGFRPVYQDSAGTLFERTD